MNDPAIIVKDVSVTYRPYLDRSPTLRRSLGRLRHRTTTEVHALQDVSFEVGKGEAFGIIGSNGAGKSTLLRVLAGTLIPDEGSIEIRGRTSTLLQLGLGFNPELSGIENVYLGAMAGGLRKADAERILDSVVEYAELDAAIQRPVKTYSSGMFARLAFSVAMHLEPEILLLDEVLAVGDESFKEKSMDTMRSLLDRAGTIVFVSHSLPKVSEFCRRVAWLEQGTVREVGPAGDVVENYRDWVRSKRA